MILVGLRRTLESPEQGHGPQRGQLGPDPVTPDIEVGFSVYRSGTTYISAGAQQEVLGDPVYDIPGGTHVQGRANLSSYYWSSTMTLGGRFP